MKSFIGENDINKHLQRALAERFNMKGVAKLNDPFRATNGFITNQKHLK